ncbi:MAG: polyprenol monophosphomannose synthase [Pirellulales bacterium]|nr:polyprenol monophosphomannose synthase [Pirellulales bacterium]
MANAGKTLVSVATYNELENLPALVEEIFRFAPEADLLVIDDNSPDGTGAWCERKRTEDPRVFCLHRPGKLGLGTAHVAAMKFAVAQGYRYLLTLDADFSHPPQCLPELIAGMDPPGGEAKDVLIGSRYVPGGGTQGWPIARKLMSRAVNLYARCLLGLMPKDCSGAYRCYRVSLLEKIDFGSILSRGYSFQEEILWRLKRLGARFGESPIVFVERRRGESKIHAGEAASALKIIFSLGMKNWLGR